VIYHLALPADWAAARQAGEYTVSTRGVSLAEQGFIHASTAAQVATVARAFYADAGDLLLLTIDESRLTAPLRYDPVPGAPDPYPHIYGPLNLDAVVTAEPYSSSSGSASDDVDPATS
jgi:uncharacterized protein (DUF952 family)